MAATPSFDERSATCASWRRSSRSRASASIPTRRAGDAARRRLGRGAAGVRERPRRRDRRPSGRARRVARRARRADDPRLRPLRRAAAGRREPRGRRRRSCRACATAASTPAARPTTRGRSSSRSRRRRRFHERRRAAAQRALPDRGRGGDRQPEPAGVPRRARATSSRPTSSSRPTARCGGRASRRSRSPRRASSRSTSIVPARASDLHSGRHGGAVQNPNHALARIVASLHDADGSGRRGRLLRRRRRARRRRPRRRSSACRSTRTTTGAEVGAPALHGEPGYSTLERLWTRPTLEVNELRGGGAFTVIPREARAHITCRLVPSQDPERVFAADRRARRSACLRRASAATVDGSRRGRCPPTRSPPTTRPSLAALQALAHRLPDRRAAARADRRHAARGGRCSSGRSA